jgi:hypothetical protein
VFEHFHEAAAGARAAAVAEGDVDVDAMSYEQLQELGRRLGEVKRRGASREQLARLPVSSYRRKLGPTGEPETCPICLEEFRDGEQVKTLACLHKGHAAELETWLRENRVCPICKTPID